MIFTDGGEEGFVGQMLEESKRFQTRCKYVVPVFPFHPPNNYFTRWYTSMLGKMSSVATLVENLRKCAVRVTVSLSSTFLWHFDYLI